MTTRRAYFIGAAIFIALALLWRFVLWSPT